MKTEEFLQLLGTHPEKELLFEYGDGLTVGANYHITEVQNITIDAVDCGGGTDFWKETVVQLWENPLEEGKSHYMTAFKALGILKKVNRMKPMEAGAPLFFEYGNEHFHTAQLPVSSITSDSNRLIIHLQPSSTDCKAKETCGQDAIITSSESTACIPGNGCC